MTARIPQSFLPVLITAMFVTSLHGQSSDGVFRKFDKNSDGKVTTDELPYPRVFSRFDTNQDGSITVDEYRAVNDKTRGTSSNLPAISPEDMKTRRISE